MDNDIKEWIKLFRKMSNKKSFSEEVRQDCRVIVDGLYQLLEESEEKKSFFALKLFKIFQP